MNAFFDKLLKRIVDSGLASRREVSGCSDPEIRDLERHFDIKLPAVYKNFLKRMGMGSGLFMQGTDFYYRSLFKNRAAMQEVLELDKNPFSISKETFVFSSHQGYIFHYFDTKDGLDNPSVYGYLEQEMSPRLIENTLSSFLQSTVEQQITDWNGIKI